MSKKARKYKVGMHVQVIKALNADLSECEAPTLRKFIGRHGLIIRVDKTEHAEYPYQIEGWGAMQFMDAELKRYHGDKHENTD